uniref:Uncharacterized protein n=1 Tax=Ciona intestinalis TaxID=7719 RepID=H2XK50_CIOIN
MLCEALPRFKKVLLGNIALSVTPNVICVNLSNAYDNY